MVQPKNKKEVVPQPRLQEKEELDKKGENYSRKMPRGKWNTVHMGSEYVQFGWAHSREAQKVLSREIRQKPDDEGCYHLSWGFCSAPNAPPSLCNKEADLKKEVFPYSPRLSGLNPQRKILDIRSIRWYSVWITWTKWSALQIKAFTNNVHWV